jgi:hypothetical protein
MNRDRIADTLFRAGLILVPAAFFLGLYGHIITPPQEGQVRWGHMMEVYDYGYDEYFDENDNFDYDHWHHDWVVGYSIQILAASLLLVGSILAIAMYRDDRIRRSVQ